MPALPACSNCVSPTLFDFSISDVYIRRWILSTRIADWLTDIIYLPGVLLILFALFALAVHRGAGGERRQRLRAIIRSAARFALGSLVLSMVGWCLVFVVLSLASDWGTISGPGNVLWLLFLGLIYGGFWGFLTAYFLAIPALITGAIVGFLRSRT
jgi:hypothetical protein